MDPELLVTLPDERFPAHVVAVLDPGGYEDEQSQADRTRHFGLRAFQQVRYRDPDTKTVMEFTVTDLGTSHVKGDWFEVQYGEEPEVMVSRMEMAAILANRIG